MFKLFIQASVSTAFLNVLAIGLILCASGNLLVNAELVDSLDTDNGVAQNKEATKIINEGMAEYGTHIIRRGFVQKDLDLVFPLGFGLDKFFPVPTMPMTPAASSLFSQTVIAQPALLPVVLPPPAALPPVIVQPVPVVVPPPAPRGWTD